MSIQGRFKKIFGFKEQYLHETSIGRIYQHSQEKTIGMMTAFRSEFELKENIRRNQQLKFSIQTNGFGFINLTGHYVENGKPVVEQSFLIISSPDDNGKLKGFLKASGHKWNQDSVLYKEFGEKAMLIGTSAGNDTNGNPRWPGLGTEVTVGDWKANKIGQFYSQLKGRGNRTFVFESADYEPNLFTKAYRGRV